LPRPLQPHLSTRRRAQLAARGAALFDGGRYFAAHECWEAIWRSTEPAPRDLWQGLVQLAAAFHHLTVRHRADVAARVLAKARRRLAAVPRSLPVDDCPVDLETLAKRLEEWSGWLERPTPEEPSPLRIPLRPARGRG
jgi:uncharacterized protein